MAARPRGIRISQICRFRGKVDRSGLITLSRGKRIMWQTGGGGVFFGFTKRVLFFCFTKGILGRPDSQIRDALKPLHEINAIACSDSYTVFVRGLRIKQRRQQVTSSLLHPLNYEGTKYLMRFSRNDSHVIHSPSSLPFGRARERREQWGMRTPTSFPSSFIRIFQMAANEDYLESLIMPVFIVRSHSQI